MAVKKLRKLSGFVIYSYLKDSRIWHQLKRMQSSKLGMWKAYHLSIEGIPLRNWNLFSEKWFFKRVGPLGGASQYETLLSTPPRKYTFPLTNFLLSTGSFYYFVKQKLELFGGLWGVNCNISADFKLCLSSFHVILTVVFYFVGLVDKILSAHFWIPLSRLTYCAYLVHPIVLLTYLGSLETNHDYSDVLIVSNNFDVLSKTFYSN